MSKKDPNNNIDLSNPQKMIHNLDNDPNKDDIYGLKLRRVIFNEITKRYADFKLKMQMEEINSVKFFRACITAYINDDPNIKHIVESAAKKNRKYKNLDIKKRMSNNENDIKDIKTKFDLNSNDIENIFDLLEEDME